MIAERKPYTADKECERCRQPHSRIHGMTPWDYYHSMVNLGKYENCAVSCTYECACSWLDGLPWTPKP